MPIYAYKCQSCGYRKDALQKMSDAPLTVCPHCGTPTFRKQVTAASFRLKGGGWYATDFRGDGTHDASANHATAADGHKADAGAESRTSEGDSPAKAAPAPAKSETAAVSAGAVPAAAPSPHH